MISPHIVDEAAEWFVELRDGGGEPALRTRFATWLCKSPEHVRAYLELAAIWAEAASVGPERRLSAQALIARARSVKNVVELQEQSEPLPERSVSQTRMAPRRRGRHLLAASMAILFVGVVAVWFMGRAPEFGTGIGEQRSITLADGSRVELNARSRLRVRFTDDERLVDLLEGQGLFQVAKDAQRPFVVRSNDALVRAVGTQFDVYRKSGGTVVTVIEGTVEVRAASALSVMQPEGSGDEKASAAGAAEVNGERQIFSAGAMQLAAGEQAIVAADRITRAQRADTGAATAWTKRELVFDSATLADVVHEFNRYNFKQLVISDRELDQFLVSGVFSSSDPASLLRFLAEQPEFQIEQTDSQIILSQKLR